MTRFCGHKTGFNPSGENDTVPMPEGDKTKYSGRGAFPRGKMQVPKGLGDIEGGNRRLSKSRVGDGGMRSSVRGDNAFSRGKRK